MYLWIKKVHGNSGPIRYLAVLNNCIQYLRVFSHPLWFIFPLGVGSHVQMWRWITTRPLEEVVSIHFQTNSRAVCLRWECEPIIRFTLVAVEFYQKIKLNMNIRSEFVLLSISPEHSTLLLLPPQNNTDTLANKQSERFHCWWELMWI